MIDVILFVTASTLSGSLLLLLIETAGRFFETKSGPGKIYLLLKISLLYFWIPIVFLALFLAGMYTYEPNLMPHEELDGFYTLNYFTDLAMERQFVRTPPWIQSLFGIWIAGAVSIGAGRSLYKRVQLHRLLENCTRLEGGRVMEAARSAARHVSIRKGISLYQCPQIAGPFLYGVFRPQMVVPERELAQEEWELIFLHEFTHYQNKDTFYRQLVEVILWIHWFNPLIYRFSHLFRDYGELACDEKVSRQLEKERHGEYARLLVKLAKESGQVSYAASFSNGNEKFFKKRISVIMRKETIKKRTAAAILAAAAAVIFCPIAALSTWGAMAIHNKIAEAEIDKRTVEEVYIPYEFVEYIDQEEPLPEAEVQVNQLMKGVNMIDFTLAAGRSKTLDGEQVIIENGIRVIVWGKNSDDQFKVGIIEPSGNKRAVYSHNGGVSYTFDVEETGMHQVYFENMESSSIQFSGVVYMDY